MRIWDWQFGKVGDDTELVSGFTERSFCGVCGGFSNMEGALCPVVLAQEDFKVVVRNT
jgi:hypothetical protein